MHNVRCFSQLKRLQFERADPSIPTVDRTPTQKAVLSPPYSPQSMNGMGLVGKGTNVLGKEDWNTVSIVSLGVDHFLPKHGVEVWC